jgi:hypothetical protein
MPDVLWPLFQEHRHLLRDLPVLGAEVLQQIARRKYGTRLFVIAMPHTFGRHLNFNAHLHLLVSQGGLTADATGWQNRCDVPVDRVMRMWRYAVVSYLREAARAGLLQGRRTLNDVLTLLAQQEARHWVVNIQRFQNKSHVLAYAGRYARRPPIAQHRLRHVDHESVRFVTKDSRTKQLVSDTWLTRAFLAALADHLPDRYRHNIRYFGLLAPRVKPEHHVRVFALLGQQRRAKPPRQSWAASIERAFGRNPLTDSAGNQMQWCRHLRPTSH